MKITRPESGEHAEFWAGYIGQTTGDDWSELMESVATETAALLEPLDESQWMARYAPEKWTIKQVVLHVIDAERVFAYRALRFSRADPTPLVGFDSGDYSVTGQANERSGESLLRELSSVRRATIDLFENLSDEALTRTGVASESEISVRALAYITLGHHLHHLGVLKNRYLGGS